jgi:hypothetical protein
MDSTYLACGCSQSPPLSCGGQLTGRVLATGMQDHLNHSADASAASTLVTQLAVHHRGAPRSGQMLSSRYISLHCLTGLTAAVLTRQGSGDCCVCCCRTDIAEQVLFGTGALQLPLRGTVIAPGPLCSVQHYPGRPHAWGCRGAHPMRLSPRQQLPATPPARRCTPGASTGSAAVAPAASAVGPAAGHPAAPAQLGAPELCVSSWRPQRRSELRKGGVLLQRAAAGGRLVGRPQVADQRPVQVCEEGVGLDVLGAPHRAQPLRRVAHQQPRDEVL